MDDLLSDPESEISGWYGYGTDAPEESFFDALTGIAVKAPEAVGSAIGKGVGNLIGPLASAVGTGAGNVIAPIGAGIGEALTKFIDGLEKALRPLTMGILIIVFVLGAFWIYENR
jgi:outer membrane lipoprotein SlyB